MKILPALAHFAVHSGKQLVKEFDHGDFRTEPAPHAAQLKADDTAADDNQALGHFCEFERAGAINDPLGRVVDFVAGQVSDA